MSTRLHEAVRLGKVEVVLALVGEKVDVNERDSNGNTPLMLSVCIKDEASYNSIVEILIENGADVNACNKGITPLYNAVFYQKQRAVEMLLKGGASVNQKNVVHKTAQMGCQGILQLLLADKGCREDVINAVDDKGRTPVYIAAQKGHKDCLKMLIGKGGDLSHVTPDGETVTNAIFEEIARPVPFILDIFDSGIRVKKIKEKNHYFVDFSVLAPGKRPRQMDVISSLLVAASDEEKTQVLQHPLIELYLTLKWARICHFFYLWIGGYIAFVLSMSIYVTLLLKPHSDLQGLFLAARIILIASAVCLFTHGVLQCLLTHGNRFRKYEMWLNLACTSLSLIVAVVENRAGNESTDIPGWVVHITSVSVLLAWTELMLLIGRLPTYGYYALMFSVVLQNVIRVLMAFLCLVIGFALSFSIQFGKFDQFSDPWRALVKTTVMMMGEFEYADLFDDKADVGYLPRTSRVIFLMFIILTSIVLMNLMVGVAVSDIQSLQMEGHARKLEKQADFLAQLEKVICSKHLNSRYVPRFMKKLFQRNSIDPEYELKTSAQFRRSRRLPPRLIDSLVAIAKDRRDEE